MENADVDLVREILADWEAMKRARKSFELQWDDVISTILPRYRKFGQTSNQNPGEKRTQNIFDSTPILAHRHFSAAMDSLITPRTQRWHKLAVSDEALRDVPSVRRYLEQITNTLFAHRYQWQANFASQIGECYTGHGAFGAAGLMIDDVLGQGIRYRNIRLNRLWFAEDAFGIVDKACVMWTLTARQAVQRWQRDALPQSIQNAIDRNDMEREFDFLHAIRPRLNRDRSRIDGRNMPIQSVWICVGAGNEIVEHSGYRVFPLAIGRFYAADDSPYGYSPAMEALPDIRMLNKMEETNLRGAQKAVDPPLLLGNDHGLESFDMRSSSLNFGYLDDQGRELAKPMDMGKNVPLGIDYANQKRESVNLAFYVTLFQILVDNRQMTATEVLQRAQEKGVLLGPTIGRVQTEQLGPLISRELDILRNAGALPPPPPELEEAGDVVTIEYDSPLNQAMRAEEGTNMLRTIEAATPFLQSDPSASRVFNVPRIVRRIADVFSMPSDCLRTEEEIEGMDQAAAEQDQAQQLLEAAPVAASAAKDLAAAQATAGSARI